MHSLKVWRVILAMFGAQPMPSTQADQPANFDRVCGPLKLTRRTVLADQQTVRVDHFSGGFNRLVRSAMGRKRAFSRPLLFKAHLVVRHRQSRERESGFGIAIALHHYIRRLFMEGHFQLSIV